MEDWRETLSRGKVISGFTTNATGHMALVAFGTENQMGKISVVSVNRLNHGSGKKSYWDFHLESVRWTMENNFGRKYCSGGELDNIALYDVASDLRRKIQLRIYLVKLLLYLELEELMLVFMLWGRLPISILITKSLNRL